MNVIGPCMKTTYTFEALVEAVAVQAGLDTSVPEDHTKACELATWMLDEGYSSIVLTHAAEFAEEKGVPAKWIALVSAIIGAVIAFSVLLVVPTHPLLCLVNRAGRLAIALTKTGTSLSPASLLSSKNSRSDVNADNKNCFSSSNC